MSVDIRQATLSALTFVAANARLQDVQEWTALFGPGSDVVMRVARLGLYSGPSYAAFYRGQPVFVFGTALPSSDTPHLAVAWGLGTREAHRAIPAIGRFIRNELAPALIRGGIRRVEVRVLANSQASIKWLTDFMGARYEGRLPEFGFNGEPFFQFAWTRSNNVPNAFPVSTERRPSSGDSGACQD